MDVELLEVIIDTTNKVEACNGLSDEASFGSRTLVASNDEDEMDEFHYIVKCYRYCGYPGAINGRGRCIFEPTPHPSHQAFWGLCRQFNSDTQGHNRESQASLMVDLFIRWVN